MDYYSKIDELSKKLNNLPEGKKHSVLAFLTGYFSNEEDEFKFLRVMENFINQLEERK